MDIEAEIDKQVCEWELGTNEPCEKCKATSGKCYFWSDGGYEPRDGTYLCRDCSRLLFEEDPYDTEEYQQFVDEMAQHCTCDRSVCPGVLAGGMCDDIRDEVRDWDCGDFDEEDWL